MIYLWEIPECPNKHIAVYNREISTNRFLFNEGVFLTKEQVNKPIIFDIGVTQAEIAKYDAITNNSAAPLVNQKIVDLLLDLAPENVQFFDAEVRCKDGILTNYKLLNITHKIIGIDHEKSRYSTMGSLNIIHLIKYLTYKEGCMQTYKIVRDEEYRGNILITEEIKQAFAKAKVKGPRIVRPEELFPSLYTR